MSASGLIIGVGVSTGPGSGIERDARALDPNIINKRT